MTVSLEIANPARQKLLRQGRLRAGRARTVRARPPPVRPAAHIGPQSPREGGSMSTTLHTDQGIIRVPTGTWKVDPTHSSVEFQIKHMMIATVKGRFTEF